MPALPHASGAVLQGDGPKGRGDGSVEVEPGLVDQVVQPRAGEDRLDLAEDGLDRVQLRAVAHVVDRRDVEAAVLGLDDVSALVHGQLVHEQRDVPPAQLGTELPQECHEVVRVDRLLVDEAEAHPALRRHGGDDRPVALVHLLLVHGQVAVLGRPLGARQAQLGEVDLVEEDDGAAPVLRLLELGQQLAALFRVLLQQCRRKHLHVPHPLAPDLVLQVQAAQGSHGDALVRKAAVEEHRALFQRLARPGLEIVFVREKGYVLLVKLPHPLLRLDRPLVLE